MNIGVQQKTMPDLINELKETLKEEFKKLITKEELDKTLKEEFKKLITKEELKEELRKLATKEELNEYLKKLVTQQELQDFVILTQARIRNMKAKNPSDLIILPNGDPS